MSRAQLAERIATPNASLRKQESTYCSGSRVMNDHSAPSPPKSSRKRAERFTEQNQTSLGQLLNPLRTCIVEFQAKVEDVYVKKHATAGHWPKKSVNSWT
jgi:DNA recombination protein RmuC